MSEFRDYNAEYYDLDTTQTEDIPFYQKLVTPDSTVLELGCGTGRVTIPLSQACKKIVAVDISESMIERAKTKHTSNNISYVLNDICTLDLNEKFDLIIAPYRVLQALEKKEQIDGIMNVIKKHLNTNGLAILNVFNPKYSKEKMEQAWVKDSETHYDDLHFTNGDILKTSDTRERIDASNQVMYPVLIYRHYRNGQLINEHLNPICMKYYYPDEFKKLIENYGFKITNTWGGYNGEEYSQGTELVIGFKI